MKECLMSSDFSKTRHRADKRVQASCNSAQGRASMRSDELLHPSWMAHPYLLIRRKLMRLVDQDTNELLYLLRLLNSRLFQWRFKLTSTNNNVGTNRVEAMSYRRVEPNAKAGHPKT